MSPDAMSFRCRWATKAIDVASPRDKIVPRRTRSPISRRRTLNPGVSRMWSTLSVYAVPLDELARVSGSGDQALVEAMTREWSGWFARIDELTNPDDYEDDPPPTCLEALRKIVEGVALRDHGNVYGNVLEALCDHLGEALEDVSAISKVSDWVDEVDHFLGELEVPLTLTDLVFGGSPVPIPEPDDYPSIGRWSPESIARAVGPLRSVLVPTPNDDPGSTVLLIRQWVESASTRPGWGLVGFLS